MRIIKASDNLQSSRAALTGETDPIPLGPDYDLNPEELYSNNVALMGE